MSRVAVIGAGPAGLIAALESAELGHEVVLLEASDRVGGMSASFEVAGQRVDLGSHRLHPATDPSLMARIKGLLGADLQTRTRNGRIRLEDSWVGFPLRPLSMARELPISFSTRVALDTLAKPLRRHEPGNFAAAIEHRLGRTVADRFYRPYAHKLFGAPAESLAVELADRRVSAKSPFSILAKALSATRTDGRIFYYPRRGYGQISEALADAAVDSGVDVRMQASVESIRMDNDVTLTTGDDSFDVDLVLSSMPIEALAKALDPAPPAALVKATESIRIRAMVLAYLVVGRDQYTPFDAHYFPGSSLCISRLSESKNYRDGDDPLGHTVLCAEIPCWVGDEIWSMDDETIGELVAEELVRSGLPVPALVATETRRLPRVYPTFETAHSAHRKLIDEWQPDDDRLVVFGRQGLAVPDNLHHVMAMGRAAVAATASGTLDRNAWNSARAEFANHVVQD